MEKKQSYAVVDIETTGADPLADRIIQFGCVLISDGEIVAKFSTDINPNRAISKKIERLTGISNARVQKAPYLEDVAPTIYNLLADTIFVAHNVTFDYSFLKAALLHCGLPELSIKGIDTVELAQIFLPTEKSFRLKDLANSLGIFHENPHQADSDAQVTAELFLLLESKMMRLPFVTMKKLVELSTVTSMHTNSYLCTVYENMKKEKKKLATDQQIIEGIALRKKQVVLFEEAHYAVDKYPSTKQEKECTFANKITYRPEQSCMMDAVYQHFTSPATSKDLFIEAATGIGKTIAYLFSLSYLATKANPAIISTASIPLQNQLLTKDVLLVNQLTPQPVVATVVKSHRHYIDLQRFCATLKKKNTQKQYALYQMKVLVWLTLTTTGDRDELHLANYEHVFWQDVLHRGVELMTDDTPFYREDFVVHLHKKMKQSNILIVNHAFLMHETIREVPILPVSKYLIIDEAQQLPDIFRRVACQQLNLLTFRKEVGLFFEENNLFDQLQHGITSGYESKSLLRVYKSACKSLLNEVTDVLYGSADSMQQKGISEMLVTPSILHQQPLYRSKMIRKINVLLVEILDIQRKIQQIINDTATMYTFSDHLIFSDIIVFFREMERIHLFFEQFTSQSPARLIKELQVFREGKENVVLSINDLEACTITETTWYRRSNKILYTGGTLTFGYDENYLPAQLGIPEYTFKTLPDPYDYEKQARLYVPTEAVSMNYQKKEELVTYFVYMIKQLTNIHDRSILVLFTSHEILARVYQQLTPFFREEGRECLAQGISGSREKIMKRFANATNAILFGADSFWTGVDFSGEELSVVVVTKLPFENPLAPFVKARYDYLEAKGLSAFTADALPKAALRLRQAFGRLIRSETDKGVLVVLDQRLISTKYSKKIQHALPPRLVVNELTIKEIVKESQRFFTKE